MVPCTDLDSWMPKDSIPRDDIILLVTDKGLPLFVQFAIAETDLETMPKINNTGMSILTYDQAYSKQQMKEMVRDTRTAIANNFLGSLESFLVYYDCLMMFCHTMLKDKTAMNALRVISR